MSPGPGRMGRLLMPGYAKNTVRLKAKSFFLALKNSPNPYSHFSKKVNNAEKPKYVINKVDRYLSLSYMDHAHALAFHRKPGTITQQLIIGLCQYNDYLDGKASKEAFLTYVEDLINIEEARNPDMAYAIHFDNRKFNIRAPYHSGLIYGKAASLFVRAGNLSGDSSYPDLAKKLLKKAVLSVQEGGLCRKVDPGMKWIEEYPTARPSMVLNGFLFYLIGLMDYLADHQDPVLEGLLDELMTSLFSWIRHFRVGDDLLYSMYTWDLCNVHYTAIMSFLFKHLQDVSGKMLFRHYGDFCIQRTDWKAFSRLIGGDYNHRPSLPKL